MNSKSMSAKLQMLHLLRNQAYPELQKRKWYLRLLLPAILLAFILVPDTRELVVSTMADAFFQVGVFVAGTLAIYHLLRDKLGHLAPGLLAKYRHWRVPYAALLGCLPGCGGAIVVVTQFLQGQLSFGAVVAVLTATMGDAAFLLIAARPMDGLTVMFIAFTVGIITGVLIDKIHGDSFLCPDEQQQLRRKAQHTTSKASSTMWKLLLVPGVIIGLMMAFQVDVAAALGISETMLNWCGAGLGLIAIGFWAFNSQQHSYQDLVAEDEKGKQTKWAVAMAQDTNFVLAWVVAAFLVFELAIYYTGFDLGHWLSGFGVMLPMMAILVGFLPGCGPQIIVTSIYLQGALPFSAQLGNAISNDGDALFPAIAMAPRVAMLATIYSAIPAIVVAYGYFWLFE